MAGTSSSITQGDPPVAQFEDALSWLLLNSDNITPAQGEIDSSIPLKFESDVAQNNPAPIPPLALSSAYLKPPPVSGAETPNLTAVEKAALEKKRLRLEKNRQSARECRKRKREMNLQEQTRIKQLERENAELRLQMKVGNEAIATEEKEKREMIAELEKLIGKKSSEEEIKSKLKTFMDRHADYGKGPKSALQYHLSQAERLLIPTQTTKMALWTVHQSRIDQAKREEEERHSQALGLADSQPAPLPMSMSMVESLSTILARELDMTEEQKGIFESKQESTRELIGELHVTLQLLRDVKARCASRTKSLDEQMKELQDTLTPTQVAKFIVWVKNNSACMSMLNQLWDQASHDVVRMGVSGSGSGSGSGRNSPHSSLSMSSSEDQPQVGDSGNGSGSIANSGNT